VGHERVAGRQELPSLRLLQYAVLRVPNTALSGVVDVQLGGRKVRYHLHAHAVCYITSYFPVKI
jgi:hypothetical protein